MEALPVRTGRANCVTNMQQDMVEQTLAINYSLDDAAGSARCNALLSTVQEQQQGENRVKSMLFHMSGEGALLTTCSKRRSPPGADVPVEWICRHRAQSNSSRIPLPQGHLGAAVAFGKGAVGGETLPARRSWRSISAVGDFDT
jgi:hypothetical protein